MIGCMSHPKKATSLCYLQNYRLSRQKLFRIKNNLNFSFVFNIGCMSQPEKATSTCSLGKYWLLRLDTEDGRCLQSKKQLKCFFFQIKTWMNHPEKFTPSCYLANCRFLRIVYGTKIVQNQKTVSEKTDLHHRMFESFKKSYIIKLSRKLLTVENRKKITFIIGCMKHSEKATSSSYLPNWFFLLSLWKDVWVIQKKLHHHAILGDIDFWDLTI